MNAGTPRRPRGRLGRSANDEVSVSHTDGTKVQALDHGREDRIAGGRRHDIVVDRKQFWSCLNCGEGYSWVVRGAAPP